MASHNGFNFTYLTSLKNAVINENLEDVVEYSDMVEDPKYHVYSSLCKTIAFIKKKNFLEALNVLEGIEANQESNFLKVYALYKLRKYSDAVSVMNESSNPRLEELDLHFQIAYQSGDFSNSIEIHRKLTELYPKAEFSFERVLNLFAAEACLGLWQGKVVPIEVNESLSSNYEIAYNLGCYYLGALQFKTALEYFEKAEKTLKLVSKAEDLNEEDSLKDFSIIRTQKMYTLIKSLTFNKEKHVSGFKFARKDISKKIFSNNSLSLSKAPSWFETKKRVRDLYDENDTNFKIFGLQAKLMLFNKIMAYFICNKPDLASSSLSVFKKIYEEKDPLFMVAQAYLDKVEKRLSSKIVNDFLENFNEKTSVDWMIFDFTCFELSRIYSLKDKYYEILLKISKKYHMNQIIFYFSAFFLQNFISVNVACSFIKELISYLQSIGVISEHALYLATILFTKKRDFVSGSEYLNELKQLSKNEKVDTLAKLYDSINLANQKSSVYIGLSPGDIFSNDFDISQLENSISFYRRSGPYQKSAPNLEGETKKVKIKRKRKNRYHKNFDPTILPDPERWLPKHERSNYKPKRKDKSKGLGKGASQGASHVDPNLTNTNSTTSTKIPTSPSKPPFKAKGGKRGSRR